MKALLKTGLAFSVIIFVLSLIFYQQNHELPSASLFKEYRAKFSPRETPRPQSKPSPKNEKKLQTQSVKAKTKVKKISLRQLEQKKTSSCKRALETFKELGDFFDSDSRMFMRIGSLNGKFGYIIEEIWQSNRKYLPISNTFDLESSTKSELLRASGSISGCSSGADLGVALASTLEAIKKRKWPVKDRKDSEHMFFKLAKSELQFNSWEALIKASGIVLPILKAHYPNSIELEEIKSMRAEVLREMLSYRSLLRKSKSREDAIALIKTRNIKISNFQEQLTRIIDSIDQ